MQNSKAVYHILVSRAETVGAFNTDFDTVNLHRPTKLDFKAGYHILVSSAETRRAFNSGFDTVKLHRPTTSQVMKSEAEDPPAASYTTNASM